MTILFRFYFSNNIMYNISEIILQFQGANLEKLKLYIMKY